MNLKSSIGCQSVCDFLGGRLVGGFGSFGGRVFSTGESVSVLDSPLHLGRLYGQRHLVLVWVPYMGYLVNGPCRVVNEQNYL